MTIDVKQFNEFVNLIKASLEKFKTQEGELASVRQTLDVLQRNVSEIVLTSQTSKTGELLVVRDGFGFQDAKLAKGFVSLIKASFTSDLLSLKDMTEGVDPEGGYTVPRDYGDTLLSLIEQYGMARKKCTIIPIQREDLTLPKLTGGVRVYWVGEGKTISTTQPSFGEFRMMVKKMAAMVPMTSELLDDTTIGIANLLAMLFAQAIAKEEDRVVFSGDAANGDPFYGALYHPDVVVSALSSGKTSFNQITADDLLDITALLPPVKIDGAEWYMHRTVFNIVKKLKYSGTGEYVWSSPNTGAAGSLWGYPVNIVETMPHVSTSGAGKPFIFFGNLAHYYIGDRKKMSVSKSEHVGFAEDRVFVRIIQREGMAYAMPETGIAVYTSAS